MWSGRVSAILSNGLRWVAAGLVALAPQTQGGLTGVEHNDSLKQRTKLRCLDAVLWEVMPVDRGRW